MLDMGGSGIGGQAVPPLRQLGQAPSETGLIAMSLPLQVQQTQAEAKTRTYMKALVLLEWKLGSRWNQTRVWEGCTETDSRSAWFA